MKKRTVKVNTTWTPWLKAASTEKNKRRMMKLIKEAKIPESVRLTYVMALSMAHMILEHEGKICYVDFPLCKEYLSTKCEGCPSADSEGNCDVFSDEEVSLAKPMKLYKKYYNKVPKRFKA